MSLWAFLYLSVPFRSSFSEALPPLPSPVVGHFIFPLISPESLISPLLNQATSNSSVVCFGPRDCHYAITAGQRRQKVKMFQPMRAREKEDDQSEDIQGAEENSSVRHKIYVDFCDL